MNIKSFCLILILFFGSINLKAQIRYGVLVSGDWNSYLLAPDLGVIRLKGMINYSIGGIVDIPLDNKWYINTGITYATKNYREEIDFSKYRAIPDYDPNILEGKEQFTFKQSYIEFPISINHIIKTTEKYYFYPSLGLIVSGRVNYKVEYDESISDSLGAPKGGYDKFLLSPKIGFGIFISKEKFGIGLEPNFRFYLHKIHYDERYKNPFHLGLNVYLRRL